MGVFRALKPDSLQVSLSWLISLPSRLVPSVGKYQPSCRIIESARKRATLKQTSGAIFAKQFVKSANEISLLYENI